MDDMVADDMNADWDSVLEVSEPVQMSDAEERLIRIEEKLEQLTNGVNTIGTMMNGVAKAFDDIMTKVNEGGIAGLLGGMMGGKK